LNSASGTAVTTRMNGTTGETMRLKDSKFYDEIMDAWLNAENLDIELSAETDVLAVERREYDDIYTSNHIVEYTIAFPNTCITIALMKITRENGEVVYRGHINSPRR